MMIKIYTAITIVLIGVIIGIVVYDQQDIQTTITPTGTPSKFDCVPTFTDGGGPYYKPNSPFRSKIVPDVNDGERLVVKGKILLNDCKTPVADAILDIWQANESGSYQDSWYRGQVKTDTQGNYMVESVIPKGYGEGTGYRPPHIHFKVFKDGREIITSQMFFPEIKGTQGFEDAFIMKVESNEKDGEVEHQGYHDIILP